MLAPETTAVASDVPPGLEDRLKPVFPPTSHRSVASVLGPQTSPPKATMSKKDGSRRRPVRRAISAKRPVAPAETPALTAPVKRKLINQL